MAGENHPDQGPPHINGPFMPQRPDHPIMQGASAGTGIVPESDDSVRVLHVDDDEAFTEVTARRPEGVDSSLSVESEADPKRALERLSECCSVNTSPWSSHRRMASRGRPSSGRC